MFTTFLAVYCTFAVCVLFHELAHFITAWKVSGEWPRGFVLGFPAIPIYFNGFVLGLGPLPLFGAILWRMDDKTNEQKARMYIAGPTMDLFTTTLIGGISLAFFPAISTAVTLSCVYMLACNLCNRSWEGSDLFEYNRLTSSEDRT